MSNREVARMLERIGDLMEIAEENPFKVRSYRRAAEAIDGLGREVTELHAAGELETIEGVGKALSEKIAEFIETGQVTYLEEMLTRYPEGLLEMVLIPGFGPKHVGQVFRELGIASVDALEAAAKAQQLRGLKGMGAKSEEKLLRSIAIYHEGQERVLLDVALPLAEGMLARLRERPEVSAAEMAGSVRRRRETIGDLDLLATSDDPREVCAFFDASFGAKGGGETIGAGETKTSVRVEPGINVDLRCVPKESYGAALLYFTGSKQHNIDLRERAQVRGLTLNEYGLFEGDPARKGQLVAGATEEEIYGALGLAWMPPELREARGELAAAESGTLPELIELGDIRCDLQMHTHGSDGHNTLEEMAEACRARGYTHMAVTDHSPALIVAGGQDAEALRAQIAAVRELNERLAAEGIGFTVLAGTEADILSDGQVDVPEGCFEELDIVLGSIHQGFSPDADRVTARIVTALDSGQVDVLAHPTGRLLLEREAYGIHLEEVFAAALRNDVAVEINANPHRLDLNDANSRRAVELGLKLSINTDAHDASHLEFMQYGVATARRGWVEAGSVVNAWPMEELVGWLRGRRG